MPQMDQKGLFSSGSFDLIRRLIDLFFCSVQNSIRYIHKRAQPPSYIPSFSNWSLNKERTGDANYSKIYGQGRWNVRKHHSVPGDEKRPLVRGGVWAKVLVSYLHCWGRRQNTVYRQEEAFWNSCNRVGEQNTWATRTQQGVLGA